MTRGRQAAATIGVVVYGGVEPIDIGGTVGVVSMASRILPNVTSVTIAENHGPVMLAGGLTIIADEGFATAPPCDVFIVTGGPGWREQVKDEAMLAFLRRIAPERLASVCTGALILAAAGVLDGRTITTRRHAVGAEAQAPVALIGTMASGASPVDAAIVEDRGVVTGGGVSLAIDATLYLLGRLYGEEARDELTAIIEYDRAFAANRAALGHRLG
ncbi:MAG: DJ-1/PfpI family protein [Phreatobacter sp.]|uniref:DJ-1/PfpI family protein n=1 Tax=Phreatobacter sp. TaxID=1966341 RepID=UPI0027364D5C|nr:DJ-1/PfpI family protein [Phreatobacter sp.]MDP2803111.1 DJ-1/PfpI family protein [Phreatobacter sp.]